MKSYIVFVGILIFWAFVPDSHTALDEINTKQKLGEKLFFDPILSKDSTISCGSCHKPEFAFADNVAISPGVGNAKSRRNVPSVMNMAFRRSHFYDGRASSLRDQVHFPIEDPLEMNLSYTEAVSRLQKHKVYKGLFKKIYQSEPNGENIADAIVAYEESLETSNTEFDAWMADRANTMSEAAIRGRAIFLSDKAKCFDCHFSPDFTADEFKNIGLYDESKYVDKGRYEVTKDIRDIGKFKVPGLRNVAVTAPYMHDGSFATLQDVVEYYSDPYKFVSNPINIDSILLKPIQFTQQEKDDLVAFLKSLTDRRFYKFKM